MKPFYNSLAFLLLLFIGCRQETVQRERLGNWLLPDFVPVHVSQVVEDATFRPELGEWNRWPVVELPEYYLIGDEFFRRDELPFEAGTDTASWKNLGRERLKDDRFIYFSFKPYIWSGYEEWLLKVSLAGYTVVNDYLYKAANGDLYVPGRIQSGTYYKNSVLMEKVTPRPDLDFASLRHIVGHFFTDKNGLWFLGHSYRSRQSRMLQPSPAPGTEAQLFERYLVYGSSVYSLADPEEDIHLLDLDGEKCREIAFKKERWWYVLTDGEKHYTSNGRHWYDYREDDPFMYWNSEELLAQLPHWEVLNDIGISVSVPEEKPGFSLGHRYDEVNSLSISSIPEERYYSPYLIYTPAGFFVVEGMAPEVAWSNARDGKKVSPEEYEGVFWEKAVQVWIYNYDLDRTEPLDPTQYELLEDGYYLYKGRLYKKNLPVVHHLTGDIRRVADTYYLTDGKNLYYMIGDDPYQPSHELREDLFGNYFYKSMDPINQVTYGVDSETLEVVNKHIVKDRNYLYFQGKILPAGDYIPAALRRGEMTNKERDETVL